MSLNKLIVIGILLMSVGFASAWDSEGRELLTKEALGRGQTIIWDNEGRELLTKEALERGQTIIWDIEV